VRRGAAPAAQPSTSTPAAADEAAPLPTWRRNLRVLAAAQFVAVSGMGIILPFIPFFVEELGVTERAAVERWSGLIFSAPFLAAGVLSPVWGHLGDRFGHRLMVVRAIVALALVNYLCVLVQTPFQFWLLRFLQGAVTGFLPAALALTSASTPPAQLPDAMAQLQASAAAGRLVGPALGGLLAGLLPFRQIFVVVGVLTTIGAALVMRWLEEPPRASAAPPSSPAENLRFAMADGPIRLGLAGLLVSMAAISMVMPIFPLFVQDLLGEGGDAELWTGIGFAVVAAFTIVGASAVGRLAARHGLKTVLLGGLAITAAALAVHPLAKDLAAMLGARALLGIGVAGVQPALFAMISRRAPEGAAGGIQGYASAASILGFFFGPFTGGWLANHVGVGGVFYIAAGVTVGCVGVAAVAAKRRGRDREIPPLPDQLPR
jgi:DHA1 family multidrug resistance protein-like MFS transporter